METVVDSSLKSFAWLDCSDPEQSFWRTSQRYLFEDWIECSPNWPRSGLMLNGTVYPLQPLAPRTEETEFSLWPTPAATEAPRSGLTDFNGQHWMKEDGRKHQTDLALAVIGRETFPTPRATDADKGGRGDLLARMRCYPTPTARDSRTARGSRPLPEFQGSDNLCSDIAKREGLSNGRLNPEWVEWLMGFPLGHTEIEP